MLDKMAQRYSQRPSHMIGLLEPVSAFQFDQAMFYRAVTYEAERTKEAREGRDQKASDEIRAYAREQRDRGLKPGTGIEDYISIASRKRLTEG